MRRTFCTHQYNTLIRKMCAHVFVIFLKNVLETLRSVSFRRSGKAFRQSGRGQMGSDDDDIHCSDYDVGGVDDDVAMKLRLRGKVHGKSGRGRKRGPDWTSVFQEGRKGRRREEYSSSLK